MRSGYGTQVFLFEEPFDKYGVFGVVADAALSAGDMLEVVLPGLGGGEPQTFQVRLKQDEPPERRAFLHLGQEALTETWSYAIEP